MGVMCYRSFFVASFFFPFDLLLFLVTLEYNVAASTFSWFYFSWHDHRVGFIHISFRFKGGGLHVLFWIVVSHKFIWFVKKTYLKTCNSFFLACYFSFFLFNFFLFNNNSNYLLSIVHNDYNSFSYFG